MVLRPARLHLRSPWPASFLVDAERFHLTAWKDELIERKQRVNEQIRSPQVRVIGADGAQLGILSAKDAVNLAREAGLDLVEVSPQEQPPVARIMDFGKFKYDKAKRRKNPVHQSKLKEIRLRPKTGAHDIEIKVKQARQFLAHKDRVQVTLVFRGRELAHMEEGQRILDGVLLSLADVATVESPSMRQAKRLTCVLTPR
jgi:translation initiation factor IF-3